MSSPSRLATSDEVATQPVASELDRIRAAYAKRHDRSIYSLFEPAQLLAIQERERQLLRMLSARGIASLEQVKIWKLAAVRERGCGSLCAGERGRRTSRALTYCRTGSPRREGCARHR